MKKFIMPTVVLVVICIFISAALAFTYDYTKPIIDKNEAEESALASVPVPPQPAIRADSSAEASSRETIRFFILIHPFWDMILTVIVAVPGKKSYGSSEMNFSDRFVRNGQPDE